MRVIVTSVFLVLLLAIPDFVGAQSYGLATGIRMGNSANGRSLGLTAQYRLTKHTTLEGILQTDFANEHLFHALIQEHQPFLTKRVNIYVGAGVSFGQERSVVLLDDGLAQRVVDDETLGVDLVAGVEATIVGYTISLDVKPNFNMVGREQWVENQVGVSLRHVVVSGSKQNKRKRKRKRAKKKKEREKKRKDRKPLLGDWYEKVFKKS